MWFQLEKCDKNFAQTAPYHLTKETVIALQPDELFELMIGESIKEWLHDFVDFNWTSPPPYKTDSTREVKLKLLSIKEVFLDLTPAKRCMFYLQAMSLPLAKAVLEDWQLEDLGNNQTRLIWQIHYKPNLLTLLINPLLKIVFSDIQNKSIKNLHKYIEQKFKI